ncbi:ABC transporter permease [Luteimonas sp. YGD11-2]|uniref:ABC transporter permease n=1 Tax=Luteimonas sp. YGD11-2 TaxID=2508168 RepID=UPI00100AB0CD|nr:ABC transporter permease [Luteimonas sp. YGD11-2]
MFGYYFNLALRSFRRNRALTALMVLAIALGIGASVTTLTVFRVLSGDPIPHKSDQLFYVRMDPGTLDGFTPGNEPAEQMTRFDAEALLREARGDRQALMSAGSVAVEPDAEGLTPFVLQARYTSADFFAMFDTPFRHGSGWQRGDDEARARVAVISGAMAERLFGDTDPTGRSLRLGRTDFRVVGVLDDWRPAPRFYDVISGEFTEAEDVYLPFSTARDLRLPVQGSMNCWAEPTGEEGSTGPDAPCTWVQYWVELGTPAKAATYRAYLDNYSAQQRQAGRFERPDNNALTPVMAWLAEREVVPSDVRLQVWLAFGFLAVCLLNTVGLLLAKFMRRGGEIGVRRALGASRRSIFMQCLVEAGTVGLAGGALGLALALLGLWAVRRQPAEYAELARMDPTMLLVTFATALFASLLAGVLPAWRAMQVTPAIQLKSQ